MVTRRTAGVSLVVAYASGRAASRGVLQVAGGVATVFARKQAAIGLDSNLNGRRGSSILAGRVAAGLQRGVKDFASSCCKRLLGHKTHGLRLVIFDPTRLVVFCCPLDLTGGRPDAELGASCAAWHASVGASDRAWWISLDQGRGAAISIDQTHEACVLCGV